MGGWLQIFVVQLGRLFLLVGEQIFFNTKWVGQPEDNNPNIM